MQRRSGFEPRESRRNTCIGLLFNYLWDDPCTKPPICRKPCRRPAPEFKARVTEARQRFPTAAASIWLHIVVAVEARKLSPSISEHPFGGSVLDVNALAGYYDELSKVAQGCGLKWDWLPEALHNAVQHDSPFRTARMSWLESSPRFSIEWEASPFMSKEQIRSGILGRFDQQWREAEGEKEADGLVKSRKRSLLPTQVRWTYKRLCRGATWDGIAECERDCEISEDLTEADKNIVGADTIRKAVRSITGLLRSS